MKSKFRMWRPGQIVTSVHGEQFRVTRGDINWDNRAYSVCGECIARSEHGMCISFNIRNYNKKMPEDCFLSPLKPKQRR